MAPCNATNCITSAFSYTIPFVLVIQRWEHTLGFALNGHLIMQVLTSMAIPVELADQELLVKIASTSLNSKVK